MQSERPPSGETLNSGPATTPRQATSVILLRGGAAALELLLVRRNLAQRFMPGFWVFPGGAVDGADGEGDAAHRAAGVRELAEEAGVEGVDVAQLVKYSRWITPAQLKTRFDTHFFLALSPDGVQPRPDGRECVAAIWSTPSAALAANAAGELPLVFPTIRQLEQLAGFDSADQLLSHARDRAVLPVEPRVLMTGETARIVLPGEPGYDDA